MSPGRLRHCCLHVTPSLSGALKGDSDHEETLIVAGLEDFKLAAEWEG